MRSMLPLLALTAIPLCAPRSVQAQAQQPQAPATLPVNAVVTGELGLKGEKKLYRFTVQEAGIFTLAGHSVADLVLAVTDAEGQVIANGLVDRDIASNLGSEYGTVILPSRGTYGVEVRMIDASGPISFTLGSSFVAMESFRRADDADGRPSGARAIAVGSAVEDTLFPDEFDRIDWYSVTARSASTLILMTRVEAGVRGDLALEIYQGPSLSESTARSDGDLRGSEGNEQVTIDLRAGETVQFRVVSLNERGGSVAYRLSAVLVP